MVPRLPQTPIARGVQASIAGEHEISRNSGDARRKAVPPLVLVGSADLEFYLLLRHILEADGFVVRLAENPAETERLASAHQPQAVILDCKADSARCVRVCARLREQPGTANMSILALVSTEVGDIHMELIKAGVDETLARPITPARLLQFLKTGTVQGMGGRQHGDDPATLHYHDIDISLDTHRVIRNGREVDLAPIEYRLLCHFMRRPGQVFSREELIHAAWPPDVAVAPRTVDVHVGRLRRALAAAGADANRTVRSAGYSLDLGQADLARG